MACQAKSTWGESGRPGSEALPAERRENRFFRFGHAWRTSADAMAWQAHSTAIIIIISPHMLIISVHYLYNFLVCIAASTCSHYYYVSLACADQTNNNNMRYNLPRWGVVARDAAISQRAMPQRVACDSRSGPAACKDVARAVAPRGVVRICLRCVPKSQTVPPIFRRQRLAGRPVAFAPRLLCARRPRRWFAQIRRAWLRRAAASEYARNACPNCKPFFRFAASNASLPGGPISPHVCFASVARGVTGRCCARRCDLAVRRPTSSLLPSPAAAARVDAAALLRLAAAFADARDACPSRRPFSRFSACNASLPGGPISPLVCFAPVAAASRGVVARDAAISPACMPHHVARASCSGPAVCKDAFRGVAPRRGVRICPRRVPESQIVSPILRRQRLAARPHVCFPSPTAAACTDAAALLGRAAASEDARDACPYRKRISRFTACNALLPGGPISPHVCFAPVARGVAGRCCARRCDLAGFHVAWRCSRVSLRTGGLQRCGPRCCAAPRCPKVLAARAQIGNRAPDSPPATPRCRAGRSHPTSCVCVRRPRRRFAQMRGQRCTAPRRPKMPAMRAQTANCCPYSPLAIDRRPAGRSRHKSALRPSPAVTRGVFARDAVVSRVPRHVTLLAPLAPDGRIAKMRPALLGRTTPSEDVRGARPILKPSSRFSAGNASLPGRLLSTHVFFAPVPRGGGLHRCGRVVASRCGARRCPRCVPKSQTFFPDTPSAVRRADLAPGLLRVRHPRRHGAFLLATM